MVLSVVWSHKAENAYLETLTYLIENSGKRTALTLTEKVNEGLFVVQRFPNSFPLLGAYDLRRMVIQKRYLLLYQYQNDQIEIIDFVDARSAHEYS